MSCSTAICVIVRETVSREDPIVSAISRWEGRTTTAHPPPAFRPRVAASSRKYRASRLFTSSDASPSIVALARRSRAEKAARSARVRTKFDFRRFRKTARERIARSDFSWAMTLADRGASSRRAISPKWSPSPRVLRTTSRPSGATIIKNPPLTGEPKRRVDGGERLPTADLTGRRFGEYAAGGERRGRDEAVVFRIPAERGDAPEVPRHLAARDRHVRAHVVHLARDGKEAERDGLDEGISQ